ncbi:MAG TPA: RNA polymerase factor sigma-54 [Bryobacteraceae bacterium]|jgi:RNA polymerase sigma-54 factor|nr:RNA polymerase factor sigma-54 [Bryobacteraceae bacterium]
MSSLSPRLQVRVQQKQILTPGLVQMVSLLQLNRLELKDMIQAEISQNPVLEESGEGGEELTPEELQPLLEAERMADPADQSILDVTSGPVEVDASDGAYTTEGVDSAGVSAAGLVEFETPASPSADVAIDATASATAEIPEAPAPADPFDEIDFGSYFDDYLDPGYKSPAAENVEKPSFETFLSSPVTLSDHLHSQLALVALSEEVRDAADGVVGNLDENGYLLSSPEEMAAEGGHTVEEVKEAIRVVQTLDPAGVAASDLRECLLLQLESRGAKDGVAWQIVFDHLKMVETRQPKELVRLLRRPMEHIQTALDVIKHLDPRPGLRYSGPGARQVEPDVYISKDGEDYLIQISDDDIPQLRLNPQYRRMLDREQEPNRDVRSYIKERYASAIQLMKNIEQRKQTILKVCQSVVRRQLDFLEHGIDQLKPMMIKEIAEEIGVHPSTVSRAVSNKYAHTPQGVFELRYFFSEAVQGPGGGATPLLILKRRVKKMIEEEDPMHPLTDEQITERLQAEGIEVTRRTVAKYREDMRIPSTHQRRVRS